MAKAKSAAASTVVQPSCAAAAPIYDPVHGEVIDSLTGDCQSVWDESELWDGTDIACLGAMSDAPKRRDAHSELPQGSVAKRMVMSSGQMASQVMPTYVSPGDNMHVKGAEMPKLPPGIPDVSTSERTVISFGMYEKDDLVSAMKKWPSPRKSARSPTSSGFSPVMPLPRVSSRICVNT